MESGTIVLVETSLEEEAIVNQGLWKDKFGKLFINYQFNLETLIELQCVNIKPIVVCEDEIKVTDHAFISGEDYSSIVRIDKIEDNTDGHLHESFPKEILIWEISGVSRKWREIKDCKKIVSLPHQITHDTLKKIVKGNLDNITSTSK